jgi:hypothetical protein
MGNRIFIFLNPFGFSNGDGLFLIWLFGQPHEIIELPFQLKKLYNLSSGLSCAPLTKEVI